MLFIHSRGEPKTSEDMNKAKSYKTDAKEVSYKASYEALRLVVNKTIFQRSCNYFTLGAKKIANSFFKHSRGEYSVPVPAGPCRLSFFKI